MPFDSNCLDTANTHISAAQSSLTRKGALSMPVGLHRRNLGLARAACIQCMHSAFLGSSCGLAAVISFVFLRQVWRSADDPQLAEFLRLMQPRRAGAIWSNEDAELAKQSSQAAGKPRAAGKPQAGGHMAAGSGAALQPTEHVVPASRSKVAAAQPHHKGTAEGE